MVQRSESQHYSNFRTHLICIDVVRSSSLNLCYLLSSPLAFKFSFLSFEWQVASMLLHVLFCLKTLFLDNILHLALILLLLLVSLLLILQSCLPRRWFFDFVLFFYAFHCLSNLVACSFIFVFAYFLQGNAMILLIWVIWSFICFATVNNSDMILSSIFSSFSFLSSTLGSDLCFPLME